MRLNCLKLCAFGPYKEKQTINFEKFKQDGLFLITGPTGSGKLIFKKTIKQMEES